MAYTHIISFICEADITKILSPDKIAGLKYLLGTNDEKELIQKYVGFIGSKVNEVLSNQEDVKLVNISLNKKEDLDRLAKQQMAQQQQNVQPLQQDVADLNSQQNNTMSDEENVLMNEIIAEEFKLISGAKNISTLSLNDKFKNSVEFVTKLKQNLQTKEIIFSKIKKNYHFNYKNSTK